MSSGRQSSGAGLAGAVDAHLNIGGAAGRRSRRSFARRGLWAAASLAAVAVAAPASGWAQAAPPPPAPSPGAASGGQVGEVVVTGSRIARRDFVAESPIVTAPAQQLQTTAPVTVDKALSQLPQFTGITGESQIFSGFGATGAATLNLRNLGSNRNLVLLDGRRMEPSTTNFSVDVNDIPEALIDNVEVITGGASATYGSDAVAGVVNFKLKHNFEGLQVDAKAGLSGRGDYFNTDDSVTAGSNFADGKGNIVVSLDYTHRDPTYERDIPFFKKAFATGAGANNFLGLGWYQSELDSVGGVPNWPGVLAGSGPVDYGFNTDHSTLFNVNTGAGYTSGVYPQNPYYAIGPTGAVVFNSNYGSFATTPLNRYSGFFNATYDVAQNVTAYAQLLYTHADVETTYIPLPASNYWSVEIPTDAAHPVPAALAGVLATRPDPTAPWAYSTSITQLGQPLTSNASDVYQATLGLKGRVPGSDWTYDVYASHGYTRIDSVGQNGYVLYSRWQSLLQAPGYGAGFNDGAGNTCTSGISPFMSASAISHDCKNYLNYRYQDAITQSQDLVEADLQGKVTDLPAGELRAAVGADYRRNTLDNAIDPAYEADAVLGGGASNVAGQFAINSSSGSEHVYELYGELLAPILRDLPFVKSFNVDLGYRYSNYNVSGGVSTYKASADWQVADFLRLRGGFQRAVRAPNVTELYSAAQSTIVIPSFDPCANTGPAAAPPGAYGNNPSNPNQGKVQALCLALTPNAPANLYSNPYISNGVPVVVGQLAGNPNLKPEEADTYTIGVVFTPGGLPWNSRLSASVDYYNINVQHAIQALDANQTTELCFNFFGTNPTYSPDYQYCKQTPRVAYTGIPAAVSDNYANQGGIKTSGVDFEVDWRVPAGAGSLDLNADVNWLNDYKQSFLTGLPYVEYAGTISSTAAYFRWRSLVTLTYQQGSYNLGARWRFLPSARDASCVSACQAPGASAYNTFGIFGSYDVNSKVRLTAGVDNLFDKDPPVVGGQLGNTNVMEYDVVGRQFYVAMRARF